MIGRCFADKINVLAQYNYIGIKLIIMRITGNTLANVSGC